MENVELDNKKLKDSMNIYITEEIAIETMQYLIRCQWTREQFAHLFMVVEG
jgi:hypothetical protein